MIQGDYAMGCKPGGKNDERVLALWCQQDYLTSGEIGQMIGLTAPGVRAVINRLRANGDPRAKPRRVTRAREVGEDQIEVVKVVVEGRAALSYQASRRGLNVRALVKQIVDAVVRDDLFAAVLEP